jgi:pyruvate kinase
MLDSMTHAARPTRAEATDVANAILDGADACMLSGETAVGEFPTETVTMMNRIMLATERMLFDAPPQQSPPVAAVAGVHPITTAVVYGASRIASQLFARMVVIATRQGGTARVKSKLRDVIPTIGVSDNENTLRQMCLFWGITPLYHQVANGVELRKFIADWGKQDGTLHTGDRVVFVTGSELVPQAHNVVVVHELD